jgi:hypothetical protein
MGFLNNSGDIIIDAVLTDEGRKRLSMGGGQFRAAKFALSDEEIDYSLYNRNNASGSAYYDLSVLQTPIFEPTTNSSSGLKTKLITYVDQNLFYLPVLLLNQDLNVTDGPVSVLDSDTLSFDLIASDGFAAAMASQVGSSNSLIDGRRNLPTNATSFLTNGPSSNSSLTRRFIRVSQGFNNANANVSLGRLEETSFSVYANNLFLQVVDRNLQKTIEPVISTNVFSRSQAADVYVLNKTLNASYFGDTTVYNNGTQQKLATSLLASSLSQVGKELQFSLRMSDNLASNPSYYFSTYGTDFEGTVAGLSISALNSVKVISTTVRVVGNSFGFSVDIPVKLFYAA